MRNNLLLSTRNIDEVITEIATAVALKISTFSTLPPLPPEEKFIDQKEVAQVYGISSVSVWQWEKKGLLQSYRIGNLKRFKLSEVLEAPKKIVRTKK